MRSISAGLPLALAIASAVLLLVPAPAAAAGERPTWQKGDFWKFQYDGNGYHGTLKAEVGEVEEIDHLGKRVRAIAVGESGSGTHESACIAGTFTMSGASYLDPDSYGTYRETGRFDTTGEYAPGSKATMAWWAQLLYDPAFDDVQFPLYDGKQYRIVVNRTENQILSFENTPCSGYTFNTPERYERSYLVRAESKRVLAGTFDAFYIETSDAQMWYSDTVGNIIWARGPGGVIELTSFGYGWRSGWTASAEGQVGVAVAAVLATIGGLVIIVRHRQRKRRRAEAEAQGLRQGETAPPGSRPLFSLYNPKRERPGTLEAAARRATEERRRVEPVPMRRHEGESPRAVTPVQGADAGTRCPQCGRQTRRAGSGGYECRECGVKFW